MDTNASKFLARIVTLVIVLIGIVFVYLYLTQQTFNEDNFTDNVKTETESLLIQNASTTIENSENIIDIPDGFSIYTDTDLGYQIAYPSNWEMKKYEDTDRVRANNRVSFKQGTNEIVLDPLGRMGAGEYPSPVVKNTLLIGARSWRHTFWPEGNSHRYTTEKDIFLFEDIPTEFRVNLWMSSSTSEVENLEAKNTVEEMLGTLTIN